MKTNVWMFMQSKWNARSLEIRGLGRRRPCGLERELWPLEVCHLVRERSYRQSTWSQIAGGQTYWVSPRDEKWEAQWAFFSLTYSSHWCVYTETQTHTYPDTHAYLQALMHIRTGISINTHTHTHTHTRIYIYIYYILSPPKKCIHPSGKKNSV